MFSMNKVEAVSCSGYCSVFDTPQKCDPIECVCVPVPLPLGGLCLSRSSGSVMELVKEHPNLCQSHVDCTKKGSGSFCARFPNADIEYGWCLVSNIGVGEFMKNIYNSNTKGSLKMPTSITT